MSTGFLKKPSRPPPPPPIDGHHRSFSNSFSKGLAVASATLATSSHRKSSSSSGKNRSDYIKISECHTGLPDRPLGKPAGFKSRASTSFSSTLKPTSSNDYYLQSSHQKSRSLTENHLSSTYLYLDLPSSSFDSGGGAGAGAGKSASNTLGKNHLGNNHKINHLFQDDDFDSSNNVSNSNNSNLNNSEPHHVSTVYKTVDFMKTDALNKCKVERTSGRGSDLKSR